MSGISAVDSELLGPLFSPLRMREAFSDRARLQAMLDVEAALARAQASVGVVPAAAAAEIGSACRAEDYDIAALGRATALAGNPAIPLVAALTERAGPEAGRYVHWGATSQDIIDTGLVLQMRHALVFVEEDLAGLGDALAAIAEANRGAVLAARTFLQQALPTTLAAKAAVSLEAVARDRDRLHAVRRRCLVLSFAGAAGTLASLGHQAEAVAEALARELRLPWPATPWHGARDRVAEIGTVLAIIAATAAKVALDIALLMQSEVGEAFEPGAPGKGGSSTMPQKRNPVGALAAVASARAASAQVPVLLQAMVAEHERALGGWHAEWTALPLLFCHCAGSLTATAETLQDLEIDRARMRRNLEATLGLPMAESLMMALAPHMGRMRAHSLVQDLCREAARSGRPLRDVARADAAVSGVISSDDVERALDPASYTGLAGRFVERALAAWRRHEPGEDDVRQEP